MTKATTKALSATIIAVFMAAILFGTWLIMPDDVSAASDEENATTSNVTIQAFVACGMPAAWLDGVEFGSVDPATTDNIPNPDENYTMSAPATNNVDIDFYMKANAAMASSTDSILLGNYTWNMTNSGSTPLPPTLSSALTTDYVEGTECDATTAGGTCISHLWLDIPSGQSAGTYNNTVTIKCNQTDA